MRNVLLVVRHEIASVFAKRSFWIMTFLFPLLIIGINIGTQIISERAFEQTQDSVGRQGPVGYVDEANVISRLPGTTSDQQWLAFSQREQAQRALKSGEVARYYIVPEDYVETGELILVEESFAPFSVLTSGTGQFERILQANLLDDEQVAELLIDPVISREERALAPQEGPDRQSPFSFWVPYATMFLFFFSLTQSSGLMLTSVSKEKENQTAEVLLLSLRPRELMLGKVIGLGIVAALQLSVWAAGGALFLDRSSSAIAAGYALPPSFFLWGALYFVFGYLTYAAALGAVGVLAPTAREGAQFTFIVLLPLMIPLWLNTVFTQEPNGTLATVLSLFPLTAPLAMVTRLVSASVPLWQPAIGVLGLAATAYLFVLLSARLFRADTLLSSASLSARRVLDELRSS